MTTETFEYLDHNTGELKKATMPIFKTPFNHDTDAEAARTGLICEDKTKCEQHLAESTDINHIMKTFARTGQVPQVAMPLLMADFDEPFDFQQAMNIVASARASFMQLDPLVREAFGNNPVRFVTNIETWLNTPQGPERDRHLANLAAMGLTSPVIPKTTQATLEDVIKAIREQSNPPPDKSGPPKGGTTQHT